MIDFDFDTKEKVWCGIAYTKAKRMKIYTSTIDIHSNQNGSGSNNRIRILMKSFQPH